MGPRWLLWPLAGHTGYGANSRCSRVLRSPGLATMLSLGSLPLPGFSHGLFRGSLSPHLPNPQLLTPTHHCFCARQLRLAGAPRGQVRGQSHRAPASGPGLLPSRPRARAAAGAEGGSPTSTFPPGRERRRGGQQGAWVCCPDKLSNSPKVTQLVRSKTGGGGGGCTQHPDHTNTVPHNTGGMGSSLQTPQPPHDCGAQSK